MSIELVMAWNNLRTDIVVLHFSRVKRIFLFCFCICGYANEPMERFRSAHAHTHALTPVLKEWDVLPREPCGPLR